MQNFIDFISILVTFPTAKSLSCVQLKKKNLIRLETCRFLNVEVFNVSRYCFVSHYKQRFKYFLIENKTLTHQWSFTFKKWNSQCMTFIRDWRVICYQTFLWGLPMLWNIYFQSLIFLTEINSCTNTLTAICFTNYTIKHISLTILTQSVASRQALRSSLNPAHGLLSGTSSGSS